MSLWLLELLGLLLLFLRMENDTFHTYFSHIITAPYVSFHYSATGSSFQSFLFHHLVAVLQQWGRPACTERSSASLLCSFCWGRQGCPLPHPPWIQPKHPPFPEILCTHFTVPLCDSCHMVLPFTHTHACTHVHTHTSMHLLPLGYLAKGFLF